jgi:hypothetical protein
MGNPRRAGNGKQITSLRRHSEVRTVKCATILMYFRPLDTLLNLEHNNFHYFSISGMSGKRCGERVTGNVSS